MHYSFQNAAFVFIAPLLSAKLEIKRDAAPSVLLNIKECRNVPEHTATSHY